MMLTIGDVLAMNPCSPYTEERVTELYAGRAECGINDFLAMDIKDDQKLFVILRGNLVSPAIQESLKALYLSRLNKMRAPRLWREASSGDCATTAHCAQTYAVVVSGASSVQQRQEAVATESAWQLARLIEAVNG